MNKIGKKISLLCLLSILIFTGLTACGEDGVKVNSANSLARKLANDSAIKINISKDIYLEEPIVINGDKEVVGNGKIIAAMEAGEDKYMITVADGGKLTIGGSVKVDASDLMGVIHVKEGGAAAISDKAVIMNASEEAANVLVEGSLEVKGGTSKEANGNNIYNMKETVISGGKIIGSGEKYAGILNEGTLTQTGGSVEKAYINISNMSGSTFILEGGTNKKSTRDGVFVAEGATMKATKKEALIEETGARGILLHGKADIKAITVQGCGDTLIKVGKRGVLNFGNGILQDGNYHGVDNAGTMTMMGGNIQQNRNSGIVNTGVLKVTSGNISNNENKGILNKHEGKADVTSAMVNFTSNKIAIANEDKGTFEFAKAKILMSTQTNVYCYDGTINMHDISLNASTSNNVRVINGVINMKNVEVKGNSQKSNTSHHGIIMDGGTINGEDVTVSMTTGCGMRIKGGVFKGKNIKMHDINRTAISMGKHDQLKDLEGLVDIEDLVIESTNYNNVLNEGGGTIKIKNGKLAVASSNCVRADGGEIELTNVTIPGHKKDAVKNIYGIYMEGGNISAKNVTVDNVLGGAIRVKKGQFTGNNIKVSNVKGDSAITNLGLNKEDTAGGKIDINGLTIKNSFSKNISLDSGVTTIKNATLGPTGGNNIKMNKNGAVLNLSNVKVEGQRADATNNTNGIMVEGGSVFGDNIQIYNTNANGIRCKLGKVDIKNVQLDNIGQAGISCSKMVKDKVELGVGEVVLQDFTIGKVGTKSIDIDAGKLYAKNGDIAKIETNNHSVKISGTGALVMEDTILRGTANGTKRTVIVEGGLAELTNVEILDSALSAIHANKEKSVVKGKDIVIKNAQNAITGSNGSITVSGLTTEKITNNNILAEGKVKVTVKNSTGEKGLGVSDGHSTKATANAVVTLANVEIKGVSSGSKYGIMAEGGDFVLKDVMIHDLKNAAIRINKVSSSVDGENVTVKKAGSGINGNLGTVTIKGFITEEITNNNIFCGADSAEKSEDQCVITITDGELCKTTSGHNVKTTMNGNVVLQNVQVKGTDATDKYGVIVEKGSSVDLTDVTIQDVPAKPALYSNHVDNVITGENVIIKNAPTAIHMLYGNVEVDGLTTESIKDKNIFVEEKTDSSNKTTVDVKNATLCKTSSHNVHIKDEDATAALENVQILGTSSNHGIMAEGGDVNLKDITINGVSGSGIRINKATSQVIGDKITITASGNGITGTNGIVAVGNLTTSGIKGNNLLAESKCSIEVTVAELGLAGGHNVKATGSSNIILKDTKVKGTSSGSHHGIMAEGGDVELNNVEISDVKANEQRAAIRVNNASSKVTGKDVTITDGSLGINADKGEVVIQNLTSSATLKNVEALGATITIKKSTLNTTSSNNVEVTAGTLTLENVDVKGGSYGIYKYIPEDSNATGGVLNVKKVTVSDSVKEGIWQEAGSIAGETLELKNTGGPAIENKNGASVEISDLTVLGVKDGHSIKNEDSGSTVVIDGATIGQTPSNNIYVSNGTVTIKNATIEGTVANHGVLAQGGEVVLENVTIKNAAQAGIRANRASSKVEGKNVTITGCADGITISDGVVEIENLDTTGVTGKGIKSSKTVKLAGKVKADILLEAAVSLEATKALTESVITLDWAEGKLPADFVAIQFVDADAMNATKANSTIKLGTYAGETYKTIYSGTQLRLKVDSIEVSNETELIAAFETIANSEKKAGLIELTGNIDNTVFTTLPENVAITIMDDGNVRTIKRTTNGGNLYKIPATTTLTFLSTSNDNANPTIIIDGGSQDGKTGTAMLENYGTLTVNSGVVLQNNTTSGNHQGIALYSQANSTTTFKGVIRNVVSTYEGTSSPSAIAVKGTITFENAVVDGLKTNKNGMIRLFDKGSLTAKNTEFKNNQAGGDGGIVYAQMDASTISFEQCTFTGNNAGGNGGATYIAEDATITNCKFDANTAGKNGGAVYNASSANFTVTGDKTDKSVFANNKANGTKTVSDGDGTYYGGGAICIGSGSLSVSGYKFTGNETKADGGAINNRGTTVTINDCEFTSNKAVKNTVDGFGGAIFMFQGTLNMDVDKTTVTTFESNRATYGGGIYQRTGTVTLHNAEFNSNIGDWNGGAFYHKKAATLKNCKFTSNTAVSKGGAACTEGGTITATNCTFTGNISNDEGGAYRLAAGGTGNFTGCTFKNNEAKKTGGGAVKYNSGTLTFDGCTFSGNKATKGDACGHDIVSSAGTKPTLKNSTFNPSNVRHTNGTTNYYTNGGGNKQ